MNYSVVADFTHMVSPCAVGVNGIMAACALNERNIFPMVSLGDFWWLCCCWWISFRNDQKQLNRCRTHGTTHSPTGRGIWRVQKLWTRTAEGSQIRAKTKHHTFVYTLYKSRRFRPCPWRCHAACRRGILQHYSPSPQLQHLILRMSTSTHQR